MKNKAEYEKMRISFDLDEVLFVSPETHKTEPPLPFPFSRIYQERLRLGTPKLIKTLQSLGYEVWVYTSSFRSERYIRRLFHLYGVTFDGIVNGHRHLREVQRDSQTVLPQKLPNRYRISLHIDDETAICASGSQYGFHTYQLDAQDDDWAGKIIARASEIKKLLEHERRKHGKEAEP
ncbi:MAG: HAD family hydrolase [Clostridia bacterium]|nr:HAD family hydrolase [Clostridia bacterium]